MTTRSSCHRCLSSPLEMCAVGGLLCGALGRMFGGSPHSHNILDSSLNALLVFTHPFFTIITYHLHIPFLYYHYIPSSHTLSLLSLHTIFTYPFFTVITCPLHIPFLYYCSVADLRRRARHSRLSAALADHRRRSLT